MKDILEPIWEKPKTVLLIEKKKFNRTLVMKNMFKVNFLGSYEQVDGPVVEPGMRIMSTDSKLYFRVLFDGEIALEHLAVEGDFVVPHEFIIMER